MTATSTGTAPISRAAWLTLVRAMPAFCTAIVPPYPTAPESSSFGVNAARTRRCWPRVAARRIAAAMAKRAKVSDAGGSHSRASLDSGTVVPHSSPAAVSAAMARRSKFMNP
jgi:hypothetical protein